MTKIGLYNQQSTIDDADKFAMEDGSTGETKFAEFGDMSNKIFARITKTTDANGWTKYDYGTHKVYKKRITFSATKVSGEYFLIASTSNLPVGITTISTNFVAATMACGFADDLWHGLKHSSTADTALEYRARANASATFGGWVDFELRTP